MSNADKSRIKDKKIKLNANTSRIKDKKDKNIIR